MKLPYPQRPAGLYIPELEKDSCGTGLIANLEGHKSHKLVEDAIRMLVNMEHRGACGFEPNTGDGAGILVQMPDRFFRKKTEELGFQLPPFGEYGVGMVFFPADRNLRSQVRVLLNDYVDEMDFELLGYRKVPTDNESLGDTAVSAEPRMEQVFVRPKKALDRKMLERKLFVLRKFATHNILNTYPQSREHFYLPSFSYKTIVYKGQLTTFQLRSFFPDLHDNLFESAIALVHSRFSTNTVPKWKLAQPFRYIAHNGEINTIKGNLNWWRSKEQNLASELFSEEDLERIRPICGSYLSDSGHFDNVLEYLVLGGRTLPQALMTMIPEAWHHDKDMEDYKKAFYDYHETIMEPWDGPASMTFTDGILVGAMLDRNGLRPSRYLVTKDNVLIVASEAGALPVDPARVALRGRLQPGKMLIANLDEHRIIGDHELKKIVCQRLPYREWLESNALNIEDLPEGKSSVLGLDEQTLLRKQQLFGFTREDLKFIITPMVKDKKDPIGSMGIDTPLAVLSLHSQHISNYFKQLFAQVTNPPIDSIRERNVMSLHTKLGGTKKIMQADPDNARFIQLKTPLLTNAELGKLKHIHKKHFKSGKIDILFQADGQKGRLKAAILHICAAAEDLVHSGSNILIISDRMANSQLAPIPSLLAVGAIHHHLIKEGLRNACSIIVEAGDIRETHHFATLIGYGADALNPYMVYSTIAGLHKNFGLGVDRSTEDLVGDYLKAVEKGLLKIMSKIGISTILSYRGAQIFEILGLKDTVVDQCFQGTVSRIAGIGFDGIAREVIYRHKQANEIINSNEQFLNAGGNFQWKKDGEYHLFNPKSIHLLQHSTATGNYETFKAYTKEINSQSERACTLRGLLTFRKGASVPIEEVESEEAIMKRFATGAMSFGSISYEAHTTLAIAMNRIGAKSNSGEGGEDEIRYENLENGDSMRSAIKQVASGRFGVTSHYLANADELQIKMAQGAKPGEGGQLPGHKVDDWIARVRHSTPGVGLISPPPHHDIYSIEDLAQLIFDLKNANRFARINVKLVSKAGVGIIASGVAKAHADAILISGHDGGTGASPLTSIRHAGLPWELGLAESHQTLVRNKLRNRVVLQTDGQLRTGRDLAIATLLGAEEWGVATAALVVEGCIMMRKCHMNTCPVGIATQDKDLRKRFNGKVDNVITFFRFLARDLREIMAELGFRSIDEMVGKVEMLKPKKEISHWKYKQLDLRPILFKEPTDENENQGKQIDQDHGLEKVMDWQLLEKARTALESGGSVRGEFLISNTDRTTGTMLSHEISRKFGSKGLPDGKIHFQFRGSAGQSFCAFGARGLFFELEGESNDYFCKGLSGARVVVYPDRQSTFDPADNIIIGNVALYGATSGTVFINGRAGERFAVRNSGATAVLEGLGDHGCEYMTGGCVVVLGKTGVNFAAGMSGGVAFVYDPAGEFNSNCNTNMVDLDPLSKKDFADLKRLIQMHQEKTKSSKARVILNEWEANKLHFVKVMPKDFKKVLAKKKIKNYKPEVPKLALK